MTNKNSQPIQISSINVPTTVCDIEQIITSSYRYLIIPELSQYYFIIYLIVNWDMLYILIVQIALCTQ